MIEFEIAGFDYTIYIKLISTQTYYVPTTLLVFLAVSLPPKILANPKSEILGFISSSSRILLVFKSL